MWGSHRLLGRFLCRRPSERRPHLRLTAKRGRRMSTKHPPKLCPTLEFDVFLKFSMDFYKNYADSIRSHHIPRCFFSPFVLDSAVEPTRSFLSARPGGRPGPSALKVRTFFAVEDHLQRFLQLISTSELGTDDESSVDCQNLNIMYIIYIYVCLLYMYTIYVYMHIYIYIYQRDTYMIC